MQTILKLSFVLVSVSLTAPALAQSGPSNRANRKITGEAYRPHSPMYRRGVYQPYARQFVPTTTFTPAPLVTAPAPAPATAVAVQDGTRTYRSFSFEPAPMTSAPSRCAPAVTQNGVQTYRSFSFEPTASTQPTVAAPQPVYVPAPQAVFVPSSTSSRSSPTSPMWRADRKATGAAYRQ